MLGSLRSSYIYPRIRAQRIRRRKLAVVGSFEFIAASSCCLTVVYMEKPGQILQLTSSSDLSDVGWMTTLMN